MFHALSIFVLLQSVFAHADVSDVYREYVDRIVPLTHDVAKKSARGKELAIFISAASSLQSRLNGASNQVTQIARFLESAPSADQNKCPKTGNGLTDIREVFRRSASLLQAVNHSKKLFAEIRAFEDEKNRVLARCQDPSAFAAYEDSQLGFVFHTPNKPGIFDGVYVVYAEGEGGSSGQNSGVEAIPIIGSIVRVVNNSKERGRIEDQTNRLQAQRAHTDEYRKYAQEQCQQIAKENAALLEEYSTLSENLLAFTNSIPAEQLESRAADIQHCAANYEAELAHLLKKEATELARRKFGKEEDIARFWSTYEDWKPLFKGEIQTLGDLKQSCESRRATMLSLGRKIGIAEVLGAGSDAVVADALAAVRDFHVQCEEVKP